MRSRWSSRGSTAPPPAWSIRSSPTSRSWSSRRRSLPPPSDAEAHAEGPAAPRVAPLFEAGDSWAERIGFWLFLSHLAVIFAIAISEVLLGLTVLSLPWTRRRGVPWRVLAPLAIPVGLYLLLLVGSIVASPDPRASTRGLTDFFTFTPLLMAPFLVRGERQVRPAGGARPAAPGPVLSLRALRGLRAGPAPAAAGGGDLPPPLADPLAMGGAG